MSPAPKAGLDFNGAFLATGLTIIIATLIMGIFANYPIVIGPGLGLNAYLAYSVVSGAGHSWQTALGAVCISGILFFAISLTPLRSIPFRGDSGKPEARDHCRHRSVRLFYRSAKRQDRRRFAGHTCDARPLERPDRIARLQRTHNFLSIDGLQS